MSAPALAASVVVPARDAAGSLPALLVSLAGQDVGGGMEVIVVDNASRDATGAGRRWATLAALPWVIEARPRYGPSLRGRLRSLSELPSAAVGDLVEVLGLARGSVRYRALVL